MLLINVGHTMNEPLNEVAGGLEQGKLQENCIDSPGAYLSAKRQALGWSVEQVADQIKLAPRQVIAIECDNYAALPPMAVTRGFIRVYAKCLKVDVTPLLAMVKPEPVQKLYTPPYRRAVPTNFSESRAPLMGGRSGALSKWNVGVIFLILLLLSALLAQRMEWLPDLSKGKATSPINRDELKPGGAELLTEIKVLRPEVNKMDAVVAPVPAQRSVSGSKDVLDAPIVPAPTAYSYKTTEKNQLVLQAHEDSWIEIKRANKSIAFSRILKVGEVEKFEINEPILLTIGNAAGVSVTLRGEPLNAKAGVNGNVARINLK